MKKSLFVIFLSLIMTLGCFNSYATENNASDSEWDLIYSTDFEAGFGDEFYSFFNTYDLDEDSNLVTDGDNTYYEGRFPKGLKITYLWEADEYRVSFDIRTSVADNPKGQNAYKTALILQHPQATLGFVCEPDNSDDDKSSYMGAGGLGIYFWENTLEIVVATNKDGGTAGPVNGIGKTEAVDSAADRVFGVYGVGYQFTLPDGKSFTDTFHHIDVSLKDSIASVLVDEALICTVELSQIEKVTTVCSEDYYDKSLAGLEIIDGEDAYRKAVIKSASGEEVLTVEDSVILEYGTFAITNRVNNYNLDNLAFYEVKETEQEPTEPPVTENTEPTDSGANATPEGSTNKPAQSTPSGNTLKPATTATNAPNVEEESNNTLLIIILICAIIAVAAVFVIIIVLNKRKKK